MFCGNCGIKLSDNDRVCTHCGTPAEYAESCGGFWGLVGEMPPAPDPVPMAVDPAAASALAAETMMQNGYQPAAGLNEPKARSREKGGRLNLILLAACAVLFVTCIILAIRLSAAKTDAQVAEAKYEALDQSYKELEKEKETAIETTEAQTVPETESAAAETTIAESTTAEPTEESADAESSEAETAGDGSEAETSADAEAAETEESAGDADTADETGAEPAEETDPEADETTSALETQSTPQNSGIIQRPGFGSTARP